MTLDRLPASAAVVDAFTALLPDDVALRATTYRVLDADVERLRDNTHSEGVVLSVRAVVVAYHGRGVELWRGPVRFYLRLRDLLPPRSAT